MKTPDDNSAAGKNKKKESFLQPVSPNAVRKKFIVLT
jgi:hypothetical protein